LLVLVLAHSLVLAFLMAMGIPWGAEGIVIAHVSTSALFILPNLYYSFAGTPVSVSDFFTVVSRPFFASVLMALVLAALRGIVPLGDGLACLLVGCGTAIVVYFVCLASFPGGWLQLRALAHDVVAGLRNGYPRAEGAQAPAE
jgi:PST family polysaccharide transporter